MKEEVFYYLLYTSFEVLTRWYKTLDNLNHLKKQYLNILMINIKILVILVTIINFYLLSHFYQFNLVIYFVDVIYVC